MNRSNPVTDVEPLRNAILFVHSGRKYVYLEHPLLFELTHTSDNIELKQIRDGTLYTALMADVEKCISQHIPEAQAIVDALKGQSKGES